jgi:hypothetical protein
MPFTSAQGPLPGLDFAVPDVYLQAPLMIPIPFFSMGFRITHIPICLRFLIMCMPSHNIMGRTPVTISGPGPGLLSGMVCSESDNITCSVKFFIQAMPATRSLMDVTTQNGISPNSFGITIVPSQIRLLNPV